MSDATQQILTALVTVTHGSDLSVVPEPARRLAEQLSARHGDVHVSRETSGWHLYMASPAILATEGTRELYKRHLAVNASMFFGWPVEESGKKHLIDDGRGIVIPDHPGVTIPITALPPDHPAVLYLHSRGFDDFPTLEKQFGLAWCEEEAPQDRDIGRFYRKLHAGWRDTPQGRTPRWHHQTARHPPPRSARHGRSSTASVTRPASRPPPGDSTTPGTSRRR